MPMRPQTLTDAIVAVATAAPDTTALVWHETEVSYGELLSMATAAHDRISALHLGEGRPVGLLAPKSPASVALVLGALLAGRPFLLPAPTHLRQVLRDLFAQAGCEYVVTPQTVTRRPAEPVERAERAEPVESLDGVSFMLTTSGSTGLPKIVPLGADAVDRFVAWSAHRFGIESGSRVLNHAPLSFDLCLLDVWTTLAHGGTVVLVDPDEALHAGWLGDLLTRQRVQVVQAVPMFYGLLTGLGADPRAARSRTFPTVRHAVFTGDVMPPNVLGMLPEVFPNARLYNVYGSTETNDSFLHEVGAADTGRPGATVPLGDPIPGVNALVVTENGTVLYGPGSGELWVHTPFQSNGYLGPARGDGRFGPLPDVPESPCWFRTGDLVRRGADGTLFLLGRTDLRVKVRGVGVDLGEVEQALLSAPGAMASAVLALPDPLGGKRLHAVVQRTPGSGLNSLTLRRHCTSALPRGATPEVVRVVDTPLPRTSTGKVDRAAVGRLYLSNR